jgi:hypothetical protein
MTREKKIDPPVMPPLDRLNAAEHVELQVAIKAEDPNQPKIGLRYVLPEPPLGMSIDAHSGMIKWTPDENQGQRQFDIPVRVYLAGDQPTAVYAEQMLTVQVNESIDKPQFTSATSFTAKVGQPVQFRATVRDPNSPEIAHTFRLRNGHPADMSIDSTTGELFWTPLELLAGGEFEVVVQICYDAGGRIETLNEQKLTVHVAPLEVRPQSPSPASEDPLPTVDEPAPTSSDLQPNIGESEPPVSTLPPADSIPLDPETFPSVPAPSVPEPAPQVPAPAPINPAPCPPAPCPPATGADGSIGGGIGTGTRPCPPAGPIGGGTCPSGPGGINQGVCATGLPGVTGEVLHIIDHFRNEKAPQHNSGVNKGTSGNVNRAVGIDIGQKKPAQPSVQDLMQQFNRNVRNVRPSNNGSGSNGNGNGGSMSSRRNSGSMGGSQKPSFWPNAVRRGHGK